MVPEPVKMLISPSGRIRVEITGRARLDSSDRGWMMHLGTHPEMIEKLLQDNTAAEAAGGSDGTD